MTVVAIHQPNFFPWLGYFDKLRRADLFVVLDNAQFQKTGGTWCNRVMLCIAGEARWMTAPVVRSFHGVRPINEIELEDISPWRLRHLRTVEANYRRAPFFSEVFPWLRPLLLSEERRLFRYNLSAIAAIAKALDLPTDRLVLASTLSATGQATELLVAIVKAVGGTAYLAGGGAQGYQQDDLFSKAGVSLVYQSFVHPVYRQAGAERFIEGLSIIDALMNCGFAGTRSLLGPQQ